MILQCLYLQLNGIIYKAMIEDVRKLKPGCIIKSLEDYHYFDDYTMPRRTIHKDEYLIFINLKEEKNIYGDKRNRKRLITKTRLLIEAIQADKIISFPVNVFDSFDGLPDDLKMSNYMIYWLSVIPN